MPPYPGVSNSVLRILVDITKYEELISGYRELNVFTVRLLVDFSEMHGQTFVIFNSVDIVVSANRWIVMIIGLYDS